jgi:choline dehydrogenase-like flavoprotein
VGLTIYTETLAKRILFDRRKRATGVEVKGSLGDHVTISAVKEVIISAGTFQSPQLLMVSGIGPSDELQEHGIEIIADRPGVGQNMWDHPFVGPSYRVKVITLTRFVNDVRYAADQVAAGILTNNSVLVNPIADFLAWEKIPQFLRSFFSLQTREKLSKFSNDWPEAEVRIILIRRRNRY